MRKGLFLAAIIFSIAVVMAFYACGPKGPETIKIGVNAPITGDIPKVGEGTKFAAEMWLEDINAAGGLQVGDKKYKVELVIEDNESKAESAVKVATKLITDDEVLAIVGPQSSKQAIPAGGKANEMDTPMISPWSTNPDTTKDRPYVFRGCFLDPFQGPVAANFVRDEFGFTKAAVLYDVASDYPKGLAEFFKEAWEKNNGPGSVVAFESFTTKDTDFSSQLTQIINSGAEVLFTPQYYNEVALIVQQAHQLGWDKPIVGSDSWGSAETVKLCGKDCFALPPEPPKNLLIAIMPNTGMCPMMSAL
jgi:branched-chain amino acid transport system substrate-binding protein